MNDLTGGSITGFIHFIVDGLLGLLVLAIILNAIMSWLVAFDVINYRNNIVRAVGRTLDAVTKPWAERRMDAAIQAALAGRKAGEVAREGR